MQTNLKQLLGLYRYALVLMTALLGRINIYFFEDRITAPSSIINVSDCRSEHQN